MADNFNNQYLIKNGQIVKDKKINEYICYFFDYLSEENIDSISRILKKFENYKLFDLHTAATLHKHLGMSLVKTNQLEDGLSELIIAFEILEKFLNLIHISGSSLCQAFMLYCLS